MNRFAQLLYGKVIYIYETDLDKSQLSAVFSPDTFWVDITGQDVEVGYVASFVDGKGVVLVKPEAPSGQADIYLDERISAIESAIAELAEIVAGGE